MASFTCTAREAAHNNDVALGKVGHLCTEQFYKIKEYNSSVDNFNVANADCSYMFWLSQSNHHQAVYLKCKWILFYI